MEQHTSRRCRGVGGINSKSSSSGDKCKSSTLNVSVKNCLFPCVTGKNVSNSHSLKKQHRLALALPKKKLKCYLLEVAFTQKHIPKMMNQILKFILYSK